MSLSSSSRSSFSIQKLSEVLTVELHATWTIHNYESAFADSELLRSPAFPAPKQSYFDGFYWKLAVRPDGLFSDKGQHVAAFVELHYHNTHSRNSLKGCRMWEEEGIVADVSLALKHENRILDRQEERRTVLRPGDDVWFPYFIERSQLDSLLRKCSSRNFTLKLQVTMYERTVLYYALVQHKKFLRQKDDLPEDTVSLLVEGLSIPVDRQVLENVSSIFRAMLTSEGYQESASNEVALRDVSAVTAQQMVNFLKEEDVTGWTLCDAVELLRVADKYAMNGLMEACENFLLGYSGADYDDGEECGGNAELTSDELNVLAEVYNNARLKKAALQRSGVFCGWD